MKVLLKILLILLPLFFVLQLMGAAAQITYITGQVVDQSGPVADASVILYRSTNNPVETPKEAYRTVTDSKGNFEFKSLKEGDYDIVCIKAGYPMQKKHITVKSQLPLGLSFFLSTEASSSSHIVILGPVDLKSARIFLAVGSSTLQTNVNPEGNSGLSDTPFDSPYSSLSELGAVVYGGNPVLEGASPGLNVGNPDSSFVPSLHPDNIAIIDNVTKKTVAIIPTSATPSWLVFAPDGSRFWVADASHNLSMFSTNGDMMATVNIGDALLKDLVVNQKGNALYLAVGSWPAPQLLTVDAQTNAVLKNIDLPAMHGQPGGIAALPDGRTLAVTMGTQASGWLEVVDAGTGHILKEIPVGQEPMGVGVSPDGTRAVVADYGSASVDIVDLLQGTVLNHVSTGVGPARVCVRPDGKVAFVTNNGDNSVTVINLETAQAMATVPIGNAPMGIASTPDGRTIFIANHDSANVSILDGYTFAVLGTTPASPGLYAFGIAVKP